MFTVITQMLKVLCHQASMQHHDSHLIPVFTLQYKNDNMSLKYSHLKKQKKQSCLAYKNITKTIRHPDHSTQYYLCYVLLIVVVVDVLF